MRRDGFATAVDELEVGLSSLRGTGRRRDGRPFDLRPDAAPGRAAHGRTPTHFDPRGHGAGPRHGSARRMTHDEMLQMLYDETLVGNAPAVKRGRRGRPRGRARARAHALRRPDPVARGGRRAVRARRLLRARDADRRAGDAGRARHPAPAARRDRRQADRQVPDGHRQGRRARHRQEPLQHHARGRRLRGHRPRRERAAGEVRRADQRARARRRRLQRLPHDDDADVQGQHQRAAEGRHPRQGDRDGRRRARSRRSTPTRSGPTATAPTPRPPSRRPSS